MKTKMIVLMILISKIIYAQDTIVKQGRIWQNNFSKEKLTHILSVSPMSRKTEKVNGLVVGFGHVDNKLVEKQTINGINAEINPAPILGGFMAFIYLTYLPEILSEKRKTTVADTLHYTKKPDFIIPNWDKTPYLKLNGINISSGCFFTNTSMNGINVSFANKFKNFNGLSIAPLGTMADNQNGLSMGIINANNSLKGSVIGVYNQSVELRGVQIGLVNQTMTNHGLQIGIFNRSYSKGFQIGIWNKNAKHTFPFLNW
jgi:phosphate/sulfate permease